MEKATKSFWIKVCILVVALLVTYIFVAQAQSQVMSRETIVELFNKYTYTPNQADIDWWGKNLRNTLGTLEDNLKARFFKQFGFFPEPLIFEELGAAAAFRPSGFKTTLSQSLTATASTTEDIKVTSISVDGTTLTDADVGDYIVYTINPGAGNEEKISCISGFKTSGSTVKLENCTRGLNKYNDQANTARLKAHSPGELIIISNDDAFLKNQYAGLDAYVNILGQWTFATTTDSGSATEVNAFRIGTGSSSPQYKCLVRVTNGDANPPKICYDDTNNKWLIYNDGVNSFDISAGGSGLTAGGAPVQIFGSEIKINTSTSEFDLDGSNLSLFLNNSLTSNSSGLAVNTTTNYVWTGRATTTTLVVGTTQPVGAHSANSFYVGVPATSSDTFSFNVLNQGNNPISPFNLASTTKATSTTILTGANQSGTFQTYTIPANSIGTAGMIHIRMAFNGRERNVPTVVSVLYGGQTACTLDPNIGDGFFESVGDCWIMADGTTGNQSGFGIIESSREIGFMTWAKSDFIPLTVDSTAQQTLVINGSTGNQINEVLAFQFAIIETNKK